MGRDGRLSQCLFLIDLFKPYTGFYFVQQQINGRHTFLNRLITVIDHPLIGHPLRPNVIAPLERMSENARKTRPSEEKADGGKG